MMTLTANKFQVIPVNNAFKDTTLTALIEDASQLMPFVRLMISEEGVLHAIKDIKSRVLYVKNKKS